MKQYILNNTLIAASFTALILSSCSKKDNAMPANPTPIQTSGVVTTFAGSGSTGTVNGAGKAASFNYPNGVAVDAAGNVYVADKGNNEIRKITSTGTVSILSGTLAAGNSNTSTIGVSATYNGPTGVAADAHGNIFVADFGNNLIRKIASDGTVTTLAGGSKSGNTNDVGTKALFNGPAGVAVDTSGNVYVADFANNLIRKITPAGAVTTLAGSGKVGSANGTGTAATFNGPRGVAVDINKNVYVADANNNLIRKIDSTGVVTTFAGTGSKGNASGSATTASFYYPSGVALDAAGNLYVADALNNLVRKIAADGTVSSLAGSGNLSITSPFNAPVSVAVNTAGNVFVANEYGNIVQVIK